MENIALDYEEIIEICESKMKECRAKQQKACDNDNVEAALHWLTAETEIAETLNAMLRRIRDNQARVIGEALRKNIEESA